MNTALKQLDIAARALAKCTDFTWIKKIQSEVEAAEIHAKSAAMERQCAIIKLRVKRRLGELLAEKTRRGRPKKVARCDLFKLRELGITKSESSRCQTIASLPNKTFEQYVTTSGKPTEKDVLRLVQEQERTQQASKGARSGGNILTGDISRLFDYLDDDSVDLVFSDPPYAEVDCYKELARLAAAKLKPGCLCLCYTGQYYLPQVIAAMGQHLEWWWCGSVHFSGQHNAIHPRHIQCTWNPVLMYGKPPLEPAPKWMSDHLQGGGRHKTRHKWEKSQSEFEYWIERLTDPGALVVDPFCGSGTVPAACKELGRRWLACELNSQSAKISRARIAA